MGQNYTSKETSINSTKLPAVYNREKFEAGSRILDYGCGKYTSHIREAVSGCFWYGYDKYNQDEATNAATEREMKSGFDYAICSNVLNVIDDDYSIRRIIKRLCECAKRVIFKIYEGDGSGIGRETKNDCWQRNEKTSVYAEMIRSLGYNVTKVCSGYIYVN